MKRTSLLMAIVCASVWCAAVQAEDPPNKNKADEEKSEGLSVGDKAPALTIEKWVKGSEVDPTKGKSDEVFVVEFWATWCGPCKVSIPHLSEMQNHFKSKGVTFIGVSDEKVGVVKKFLDAGWDAKMQYTVAVDKGRKTSEDWMEAAGKNGIPTAFVVRGGKIIWIGNPLSDPLDVTVAEACGDEEYAAKAKEFNKFGEQLREALKEEEWDDATKVIDKMLAKRPGDLQLTRTKYMVLAVKKKDKEAAGKAFSELVSATDEPQLLNEIAWTMLTEDDFEDVRDVKLATTAAKKALDLTKEKDPAIMDTYARALADGGDLKGAIEWQKKAVALCKSDKEFERFQEDLEKALEDYESR